MIVNYGPASRIADDEILVRLKEVEDQGLTITERLSGIEIDIDSVETKVSEAVTTAAGTDEKVTTLTQNVDDITARVEEIKGSTTDYTEIKATLDGLSITTENGKTIIDGGNIDASTLNLTDKITFSQIGGTISKDQLDTETQTEIKDQGDALDQVLSTQGQFSTDLENVKEDTKEARDIMADWIKGEGTTYIDGSCIKTNSLYTNAIHLGGDLTVYNADSSDASKVGYLGYTTSNLQSAVEDDKNGIHMAAFNSGENNGGEVAVTGKGAAIRFNGATNQISVGDGTTVFSASGTNYYLQQGGFRPHENKTNTITLGTSAAQWSEVHAGTGYYKDGASITSDINLKNSIEDLPEKYITMFDKIEPKRFKLNDGTSDRYHVGFISQEVEEAMDVAGVDSKEFGGFVIYRNDDDSEKYMLRYQEFIGIMAAKIKQLESRIEELEAK